MLEKCVDIPREELCMLLSLLLQVLNWIFIDLVLEVIALFTLPKVYETNKAQIDQNLALVHGKINELTAK